MNVVMTGKGLFVEVQGTAEGAPFSRDELDSLLELAAGGIRDDPRGRSAPTWPSRRRRAPSAAERPGPVTLPERIVVASANPKKAAEIAELLVDAAGRRWCRARPTSPRSIEDGDTFEDNARLKAVALAAATGDGGAGGRLRARGRRARRRAGRALGPVRG